VHLHGCLKAEDLWTIGKDNYKNQAQQLDWYADEFSKHCGYKPDYQNYWRSENGLSLLKKDFEMLESGNFSQFQAKFNLIIALCPLSFENFYVQEKIIRQQAASGLNLFEARTLIPFSFTSDQAYRYLKGLCQLVSNLNSELPMETRLVFSLFRQNHLALKHYLWIKDFLFHHPVYTNLISGIDFAYDEKGFPPSSKINLIQKIKQDNLKSKPLKILYHVGESFEDKGLLSATRWVFEAFLLGVDRLGHAIALGVDPENYQNIKVEEAHDEYFQTLKFLFNNRNLLFEYGFTADWQMLTEEKDFFSKNQSSKIISYTDNYKALCRDFQRVVGRILKEKRAIIECCPTSNKRLAQIKYPKFHPILFFAKNKISTVLGTDDPGVFCVTYESEYSYKKSLEELSFSFTA
tara:strand:- start:203 stop:1420 length:1218 start_codon:yes stop_codon:yes gene_type:complete